MKGLLYKEFLVIRGRILLMGIGIALLAFLMLRIAFPGADVIAKEEELSSIPVGYMYDTWLMFFAIITPALGIGLLTPLVKMLTESGRRRKERAYTMALPLPADSAVKAKYITFAGCVVLFLAVSAAMTGIYLINAGDNQATERVIAFFKMIPLIFAVILVIGSVEMFAYLGLGKKKGDALLILLLVPLALVLVWCLFFINPKEFSRFDIGAILRFYRKHKTLVRVLGAVLIAGAAGLYYLSFRIVRKMELNRKAEFDE
jgi:hypothetical protein